jgi:disulfide bond formation protein DsbB
MGFFAPLKRLTPQAGLFLLGLGASGIWLLGLAIQQMENLQPCPLCIFQRVLYMTFGLAAALGGLTPFRRAGAHKALGLALALAALVGFGTALYQSVMQARPDLIQECSLTDPGLVERFVNWLAMQYPPLFMPTGMCASQEWSLFGLSMANWSLFCFLCLGLLALWVTRWFGGTLFRDTEAARSDQGAPKQ